ncbi:MAG TPA: DUF1304 domain-containing protein [Rhizomicrobium sp.]|nr:DUF1304 domain-containing protein [Rhizomicrobium sp.]
MCANVPVVLLAILTIGFGVVEMLFGSKSIEGMFQHVLGPGVHEPAVWAKNQGLYNFFLAAGLIWAAICPDAVFSLELAIFFLGCIAVAGLVGACTVRWTLLVLQTLPAAIAIAIVLVLHAHSSGV